MLYKKKITQWLKKRRNNTAWSNIIQSYHIDKYFSQL